MQNEFAGTLHPSRDDMLDAIAADFWTARGTWSPDTVTELAKDMTAEQAADEAIDGWGLDGPSLETDDGLQVSHMDANGYTRSEVAAAMQRFIDTRPDREAE